MFDRALASVYPDPEQAHREYLAMGEESGVTAASPVMKKRPEQFGPS